MTKRPLTEQDRQVWRRVSRTVTPFADRPPVEDVADAELLSRAIRAGTTPKGGTTKAAPAPAEPRRTAPPPDFGGEKRVRRGRAAVEARLDLHGHTQESARGALLGFLQRQRGEGARCVLVITGKGRLGAGVLKARFLDWLAEPEARPHVSGYAQAHQRHGGSGAYYVFLKRPSPAIR